MNLKNMRECDNSKIHISNNSLLSILMKIYNENGFFLSERQNKLS